MLNNDPTKCLTDVFRVLFLISALCTFAGLSPSSAQAETVTIITWNVSGSVAAIHDSDLDAMLVLVDPDLIVITEGGPNSQLSDNFGASYTLVEENDGQEVWLSNDSRFSIGASGTGSWNAFCNNIPVDGSWAHIVDSQSGQDLTVYVPHFCVSDNFAGSVDIDPSVSNEDQQASVCTIIGDMEAHSVAGEFVVLAGDYNVQQVDAEDSIVAFLEGTNDLDPAYCSPTTTTIGMVIGAQEDVQRIMGTGGAATYSNVIKMSSAALGWGAGSHGWVAVDVELAAAPAAPSFGVLTVGMLVVWMGAIGSVLAKFREPR
jgi:hypothetical protein